MDTKKCDDHKQEKKSKIIYEEEATPLSESYPCRLRSKKSVWPRSPIVVLVLATSNTSDKTHNNKNKMIKNNNTL